MPPFFLSGTGDMFGTFRKIAYTLLSPKFYTGLVLGFYVGSMSLLSYAGFLYTESTLLEQDQVRVQGLTGAYFADYSQPDYKIFTYEKVCKGFGTIEVVGDQEIYTGYGDASEEFTYTVDIVNSSLNATSTATLEEVTVPADVAPVAELPTP